MTDIDVRDHFLGSFGLLKVDALTAASDFQSWYGKVLGIEKELKLVEYRGSFDDLCRHMFPLVLPMQSRFMFIQAKNGWTVFFDNGLNGTDAQRLIVLTDRLNVLSMRISCATRKFEPLRPDRIQYWSVMWEVYEKTAGPGIMSANRRGIAVSNDGGRWGFYNIGEPFDFEDTAVYSAKKLKDRFNKSILMSYLAKFDAFPFDADFFYTEGCAYMVMDTREDQSNFKKTYFG